LGLDMTADTTSTRDLVGRIAAGDVQATAELFAAHRERLRQMVRLRLDRRLQGRLDTSDVLKEAFQDVAQQASAYAAQPTLPAYLWLRSVTGRRLLDLQHRRLGAAAIDAGQEVSLYRGALPQASSVSLANQLLGRPTSASQAAVHAATQLRVQEALNTMDSTDREVLTLRHFEMLTNEEAALVLGIRKSEASRCYLRALRRLQEILAAVPRRGAGP
jgi:RNA polymerase sigma-70 factor (ECF subfamily)